jgi:hypothetical protein
MKRVLFITAALCLLAGCTREESDGEKMYLDPRYVSAYQCDLPSGTRSLAITIHEALSTGEGQVVPGKLLVKEDYEFITSGLCSRKRFYAVSPDGEYREEITCDYAYDAKARITRELQTYRRHDDLLLENKSVYTYDERAGTATCIEYAGGTPGNDDYTSVVKRVYPLKENGHAHWGTWEEYNPTRAATPLERYERVILATDARGNWTESYLQEERDGQLVARHDYTTRHITYH